MVVLPKRERQVSRQDTSHAGQEELFAKETPVPHGDGISPVISESALLADFGTQLGGKTKLKSFMLGKLVRLGFIERRGGLISEGPLLDLALDYRILAERIIHGTLADVLSAAGHPLKLPAHEDLSVEEDDDENDWDEGLAGASLNR